MHKSICKPCAEKTKKKAYLTFHLSPMVNQEIKRGDIFYADLNPVQGSEQSGVRPVLIVQNALGNQHSPTVVIVPLTSSKKAFLPTHVRIARTGSLVADSTALCEHVRTIDRRRLDGYIGRINENTQMAVDAALAVSVGLDNIKMGEGSA